MALNLSKQDDPAFSFSRPLLRDWTAVVHGEDPSCMAAELVVAAMSSPGPATSSAGIPMEHGVPVWSGDPLKLDEYETAALWFRSALKPSERSMAAARLWGALRGPARGAVKDLKPSEFEAPDGVERLLAKLKNYASESNVNTGCRRQDQALRHNRSQRR